MLVFSLSHINKLERQVAYPYLIFINLAFHLKANFVRDEHSGHAACQLLSSVHSIHISIFEIMLNA